MDNQKLYAPSTEYQIREFEWFEVETRIRRFVNELLNPTIKRIADDRKLLDKCQNDIRLSEDKVQSLQDILMNNREKIPFFADVEQKFHDVYLKIDQDSTRTKHII